MIDEDDSFDPRTWASPAAPSDAPAPTNGAALVGWQSWLRQPLGMTGVAGAGLLLIGTAYALMADSASPPRLSATSTPTTSEGSPEASRRTLTLPGPGALEQALLAAGIDGAEAAAAVAAAKPALAGREGALRVALTLEMRGARPRIARLEALFEDSSGVVLTARAQGGFDATKASASLTRAVHVVQGEMDSESFYSSAVSAGVPDILVSEVARALAFDFDFQWEIRPGNVFEVGYEQALNREGGPVGLPHLVFVSMSTADKSVSIYRFKPKDGEEGWYDGNGASTVRALMRTPVDGARVSSNFGMRMHPIQHFMKMHNGTDFAAPIGTPIYAAGDAQVEYAAPKGANGNFVLLRHDNGWLTLYLHLSRFAPGLAAGGRVRQGQLIGEVGATGAAKGPHLHYEVHIDGKPVDPLTVPTGDARKGLAGEDRAAFLRERDRIDAGRAGQGG